MIPIVRPILGDEEVAAVREVLASGMLAQGPKVKAFESAFAKHVGCKQGIAVANGTEALHIALTAHGIGVGNEVLIPPLTFFATASTVLQCEARPVFVDVTRDFYNMDPAKVIGWVCECGRPLDAKFRCAHDGKSYPELSSKRKPRSRSLK